MASIADTLSRKMKLPPTVRPPANPQFDYQAQPGQFYPGAQDQTDAQLLETPWRRNMALPGPAPPKNFGRLAAPANPMQKQVPPPAPPKSLTNMAADLRTHRQAPYVDPLKRLGEGVVDAGVIEPAKNVYEIGAKLTGNRPDMPWTELLGRTGGAALDFLPSGLGKAALIGVHATHQAVGRDKLLKAIKLDLKGASPRDIEDEAGLFRGPEGHWRHEISDEGVKINTPGVGATEDAVLKDVYQHPELMDAWKNLQDTKVEFRPMGKDANTVGSYQGQGKFNPEVIRINSDYDIPTQRNTIIHEVAHPVQAREGFARGADQTYNPSDVIHQKLMRMELVEALQKGLDPINDPALMQTLQQRVANLAYRYSAGEREANTIMDRFLKGDYERYKTRFYEEPRMDDPSIFQINAPPRTIIRPPVAQSQKAFYDMFRNPTRKAGTLKLP